MTKRHSIASVPAVNKGWLTAGINHLSTLSGYPSCQQGEHRHKLSGRNYESMNGNLAVAGQAVTVCRDSLPRFSLALAEREELLARIHRQIAELHALEVRLRRPVARAARNRPSEAADGL